VLDSEKDISAAQYAQKAQDGVSGPFRVAERTPDHP
jgi:hypothetical protein